MSKDSSPPGLPLSTELEWLSACTVPGGIFAYICWAIVKTIDPTRDPDGTRWAFVGAGLGGVFGLTYLLLDWLL